MDIITFSQIPINGCQSYRADFRDLTIKEIEKVINMEVDWWPYGYNYSYLCRFTGTVYITRQPLTIGRSL